jgi:arylsulfatase A-like enzyme
MTEKCPESDPHRGAVFAVEGCAADWSRPPCRGHGGITEIATAAPGYSSIRPQDSAPLAETLKLNGYSTAQFGKCHEAPAWQSSPMGPFEHWPVGSGFEKFYGFVGGETNQW